MFESLKITNIGPIDALDVHFAPRLNILTGDNGLGKTFLLDWAWLCIARSFATRDIPRPKDPKHPSYMQFQTRNMSGARLSGSSNFQLQTETWHPERGFHRTPSSHDPLEPGLVIYFRLGGGVSVWDRYKHRPSHDDIITNTQMDDASKVAFLKRIANPTSDDSYLSARPMSYSRDHIFNGARLDGKSLIKGLVEHWNEWETREPELFSALQNVMSCLSTDIDEPLKPGPTLRKSINDDRLFPTIALPYGNVAITDLSAGMSRILSVSYILVWAWNEHREAAKLLSAPETTTAMILFDEVEAHLHPKWQRSIVPSLLRALDSLNPTQRNNIKPQIMISTHSPLVLASLESHFDSENDKLFNFDLDDGRVVLREQRWLKRGDASSWLTSPTFDMKSARSIESEKAIEEAMAAISSSDMPPNRLREIHHKLQAVLKDVDPFWARWLYYADKKGIHP